MMIRKTTSADLEAMWSIFQSVISTGDTLPFADGFDREAFQSHWFGAQASYIAVAGSEVLGMYKFGANYPGLGSHVASATYVVRPDAQGKGIGRALVERSLAPSRE
jgi:L-amino acid N-acyltransferase YncA